jgi:GR25 family glycosyltransferase involved in LPS biosynthesis
MKLSSDNKPRYFCLEIVFALIFIGIAAHANNPPEIYDVVYVINLDRNPERLASIKEQFDKEGVRFTRFSAVDGYNVKLIDKRTGETVDNKIMPRIGSYSWKKRPILYHVGYGGKYPDAEFDLLVQKRRFSAGEIGVIYSHRAFWRDIIKHGRRNAIFFEDDVTLVKKFERKLKKLIDNNPRDSDITFLSIGRRKEKKSRFPVIENIFRDFDHVKDNSAVVKIQPTNRVFGMCGYLIGVDGARKLLRLTDHCEYPLDDVILQQGGVNTGAVKAHVAAMQLCYPQGESEITKMGRSY